MLYQQWSIKLRIIGAIFVVVVVHALALVYVKCIVVDILVIIRVGFVIYISKITIIDYRALCMWSGDQDQAGTEVEISWNNCSENFPLDTGCIYFKRSLI